MTVAGKKDFGYLFWATECLALSGLLLYTVFLTVMGEKHWKWLDDKLACGLTWFDAEDEQDKLDEDRTNFKKSDKL